MPLTINGAQSILDTQFGGGTPATWYLALFLTSPGDTGGGTEVTGGDYARLAITNNNTNWAGATATYPSQKSNGVDFVFPTADADWGIVGFWALFDASTGGTMKWWGTLANAVDVPNGGTYTFATGTFILLMG